MKPTRYAATWKNSKGQMKAINTNNEEKAKYKASRNRGLFWYNPRYDAEMRLRRIYINMRQNHRLPETIDYPHLAEYN